MPRNQAKPTDGAIVVLEPDDDVRHALHTLLQGQGWRIESTCAGQALAGILQRQAVAAVISEASLPDCPAGEILGLCASRKIPLIFTGHDLAAQAAVDLVRQGADDYLEKPFSRTRLLDLLNHLSGRQTK